MEHAILSASASNRWLNCPPSARLEATYENKPGVYAQEGTLAHKWAENELRQLFGLNGLKEYHQRKKELQEDPLFCVDMLEHIETYKQQIEELTLKFGGHLELEKKVDFSHIVPEGFGICDCLLQNDDTIIIVDLKYGMGIQVSAENNSQLRLYSLGAMTESTKKIINVIVQPRLHSISSCEYTRKELEEWAKDIEPIVKLAFAGKGEFKTGEHCKYCLHKTRCMKQYEETVDVSQLSNPEELSIQQLCELLNKKSVIEDYLKSISAYALNRVKGGESLPGYKLVLSRTIRKYKDPNLIVEALERAECPENCFKVKEPISIGQMEKVLGKARFQEILGDLVVKPDGEPTLVEISDKREEYLPEDPFAGVLP